MDEAPRLMERSGKAQGGGYSEEATRRGSTEFDRLIRVTFDTDPNAIILSRLDTGEFVDVNNSFCNLTGYAREGVVGKITVPAEILAKS